MEEFESKLRNCSWGQGWRLIDRIDWELDENEILVPSSHPDSDAELEKEPVYTTKHCS